MKRMNIIECYGEMKERKNRRLERNPREDVMKIVERDACIRYKHERDNHGMEINKLIKEKTKKDAGKFGHLRSIYKRYSQKRMDEINEDLMFNY